MSKIENQLIRIKLKESEQIIFEMERMLNHIKKNSREINNYLKDSIEVENYQQIRQS